LDDEGRYRWLLLFEVIDDDEELRPRPEADDGRSESR
jgi:hypothetical protein